MIAQPQDYKLVSPVGLIDGGILPARDVAADGSAHALRTEDACFLAEAGRRINAYRFSTSGVPYGEGEPGLVLDRGPFVGATHGIQEGAVRNASDVRTWPKAPVLKSGGNVQSGQGWRYIPNLQYGTPSVGDITCFWDACLTSETASAARDFVASTLDFNFGKKALWNDNVRKVYHDLDRVKGVMATGSPIFTSGSTLQRRDWRQDGTIEADRTYDYTPGSSGASVFRAWRDEDSFFGPQQDDYAWTCTGVQNPAAQSGRLADLRGVPTSCWALWTVTSTMKSLSNSNTLADNVDGFLVDATITQAGNLLLDVPVTASSLLQLCVTAHRYDNYPLYDYVWDMPTYRLEEVSATYVGVMFYDAGIDISALNWNWTP